MLVEPQTQHACVKLRLHIVGMGRGQPLKAWREGIKKDMLDCQMTDGMVYDMAKWRRTHKAEP